MTQARRFDVNKEDLTQTRWVDADLGPLADGAVRISVGTMAFTANNVTYALTGKRFGYWQFFPTGDEAWTCVPVWGFAEVVESRCDGIDVGERLYGYFPMGTHLDVHPTKVTDGRFVDGAAHRAGLPAIYNEYQRTKADPTYTAAQEPFRALIFPLAATSYGLADWLEQSSFQGAQTIGLISASSKTAIGTAHLLQSRKGDRKLVGFTSEKNKAVVEKLGFYDQVLGYDEITQMDATVPTVLVDFAGNPPVNAALHGHLGENMRHTALVGASHGETPGIVEGMNKDRSVLFFMPSYAAERIKATGGQFVKDMMAGAGLVALGAAEWMHLRSATSEQAVEELYHFVREGRIMPDEGGVIYFDQLETA